MKLSTTKILSNLQGARQRERLDSVEYGNIIQLIWGLHTF